MQFINHIGSENSIPNSEWVTLLDKAPQRPKTPIREKLETTNSSWQGVAACYGEKNSIKMSLQYEINTSEVDSSEIKTDDSNDLVSNTMVNGQDNSAELFD